VLFAFLVVASPSGVFAQAPAPVPEVRITGFIDTITSWSKNFQDSLVYRTGDQEWYTRNRGRVDLVGQLGAAKAVLGIEIDSVWGQVSGGDNNLASGGIFPQRFGATSSFDLNTDTQGSMEVKWLYTEFPLSFLPIQVVVRLGAQPFVTPYKVGVYATGDFPGVNIDMTFSRHLIGHLTYVAIEENLTGGRRNLGFGRGDDWAMIATVEALPLRGLELQPLYSFVQTYGSTNANTRGPGIGSITGPINFTRASPGGALGVGEIENRHTIGIDARWRSGPFSLEPTVFYQFGDRDTDNPFVSATSSAKDRVTQARTKLSALAGRGPPTARRLGVCPEDRLDRRHARHGGRERCVDGNGGPIQSRSGRLWSAGRDGADAGPARAESDRRVPHPQHEGQHRGNGPRGRALLRRAGRARARPGHGGWRRDVGRRSGLPGLWAVQDQALSATMRPRAGPRRTARAPRRHR